MNTTLPYSRTWEILAEIKNNLDLNDLEKSLINNRIIQKPEEIIDPYYQPDPKKFGPGLGAEVHADNLKIEVHFYHSGKKQ